METELVFLKNIIVHEHFSGLSSKLLRRYKTYFEI